MWWHKRRLGYLSAAVMLLLSCNYHWVRHQPQLPANVESVWVPMFGNQTAEPHLEAYFTEAARETVSTWGLLGNSEQKVRIEGTIVSVGGSALVATAGHWVNYRVDAALHLKLLRADGTVSSDCTQTGSEEYPGGADVLLTESNREAAVKRLAVSLTRDALERLLQ